MHPRASDDHRFFLVVSLIATLAACGDPEPPPPSTVAPAHGAVAPDEVPAAVASTPPPPAEPVVTIVVPPVAAAPVVDPARTLAHCLWYADASVASTEGPSSMQDLDERLAAQLGREVRVVGRVRLAARGCSRLSAGIAVVRNARDDVDDDDEDEGPAFAITGDDEERAPISGARGDERRDGPWDPSATAAEAAPATAACNADAPPTVFVFRAQHAANGDVESLVTEDLELDACGFYGHELEHGDLDHDGSTELRIETRTGGWAEMSAGAARDHRLWIYDLASMRVELALRLGGQEAAEEAGYREDRTRGSFALRDVDEDGDRDVIVRRFSEGYVDDPADPYRDWTTEVHAYDPAADTFVRAAELDARAAAASH